MHLSIESPSPHPRIRVGLCGGIDSKISPRGGAFVKMASEKCAWESTREWSASLPHQMDTNPHLRGLHQKNAPGVANPTCQIPTLTRGGRGICIDRCITLLHVKSQA